MASCNPQITERRRSKNIRIETSHHHSKPPLEMKSGPRFLRLRPLRCWLHLSSYPIPHLTLSQTHLAHRPDRVYPQKCHLSRKIEAATVSSQNTMRQIWQGRLMMVTKKREDLAEIED